MMVSSIAPPVHTVRGPETHCYRSGKGTGTKQPSCEDPTLDLKKIPSNVEGGGAAAGDPRESTARRQDSGYQREDPSSKPVLETRNPVFEGRKTTKRHMRIPARPDYWRRSPAIQRVPGKAKWWTFCHRARPKFRCIGFCFQRSDVGTERA